MKICQSCGYQNEDNAKFCASCGNNISQDTQNTLDFNPNKNTDNQETQQPIEQENTNQTPQPITTEYNNQQNTYQPNYTPQKKKNAIIAILLDLIGALFFYFLSGIGQLYLGLYKRGVVIGVVGLLISAINAILTIFNEAVGVILALILGIALAIYSAYDANECTKAINEGRPIPLLFGKFDVE